MGNGITSSQAQSTGVTLSSSDSEINALIDDSRWGTGNGATVTLTYSFESSASRYSSNYSSTNEYLDSQILRTDQKTAVRTALAAWSRVANLSFAEVTDSTTEAGDLRFGIYNNFPTGTAAWGYYPGQSAVSGDVWISDTMQSTSTAAGGYYIELALHEIGHALGLKHPFEEGDQSVTTLPATSDTDDWTVMSYTHVNTLYTVTPQALDIKAIQYLYGANTSTTAGNDSYQLSGADQTVWDYSGTDSLIASDSTRTYSLDLRAGHASTGQGRSNTARYYIMSDTAIENATGSSGNDTITGNDLNNTLTGGAGFDTIDGGAGTDSAVYSGAYSSYTVTRSSSTVTVRDLTSSAGDTDTLTNIEQLVFSDQTVSLASTSASTSNVAGSAIYRFYNKNNGTHFFTATTSERDYVIANLSDYSYEGAAFSAVSTNVADTTAVYRFYNVLNGTHFYTANESEKNAVVSQLSNVMNYEGEAYRAVSSQSASATLDGMTALYRFYNKAVGSHFFTVSESERDSVIANLSQSYNYEGIAYYVASATTAAASITPKASTTLENQLQGGTSDLQTTLNSADSDPLAIVQTGSNDPVSAITGMNSVIANQTYEASWQKAAIAGNSLSLLGAADPIGSSTPGAWWPDSTSG